MGVDLGSLVPASPISMRELDGRVLVFDGNNIMYQFIATIRQADGRPLSDDQGRPTSHLAGTLYRTANLVEAGILPVFVWDGKPDERKMATIQARRERREKAEQEAEAAREAGDLETARSKAAQASRLTREMIDQVEVLLGHLGIPSVQAPGEGEAQAAQAVRDGAAHASVSQDFDSLLFGAPRLVRNLTATGRRKVPGRNRWVEVKPELLELQAALDAVGLTRGQLVGAGVLMGTDFHPGVKGIGAKRAVAAMRTHGDLRTAAEALAPEEAKVLELVASIFLEPVVGEMPPLSWGPVDGEAVQALLGDGFGFSHERVSTAVARYANLERPSRQGSLTDFF